MMAIRKNSWRAGALLISLLVLGAGCSGGSLTTREKGEGIGALGGATAGGIIGTAVGHPNGNHRSSNVRTFQPG